MPPVVQALIPDFFCFYITSYLKPLNKLNNQRLISFVVRSSPSPSLLSCCVVEAWFFLGAAVVIVWARLLFLGAAVVAEGAVVGACVGACWAEGALALCWRLVFGAGSIGAIGTVETIISACINACINACLSNKYVMASGTERRKKRTGGRAFAFIIWVATIATATISPHGHARHAIIKIGWNAKCAVVARRIKW